MELKELLKRALEIKEKYHKMEDVKIGKRWTNDQIMEGFVGDVGELMKVIMAKEGLREMENIDEKLAHELADCLYCVLVLSGKYGIDIEKEFLKTMEKIENKLKN
jgi:NTP pyrophosphatase (non-canonical NTP hydrolase)